MSKVIREYSKTKQVLAESFKMIKAFFVLFLFFGMGEAINYFIPLAVPGSILGMILIFIALKIKLIHLETVKPASDVLIKYMVLFFVPFGVGLMAYFDFIQSYWIILSVAVVITTLVTLYLTALIQEKLEQDDCDL